MKKISYIATIGILLSAGIVFYLYPQAHQTIHHYFNFILTGRSSLKFYGILTYLLLLLIIELIPYNNARFAQKKKIILGAIVLGITIALFNNFLAFIIVKKYHLPLNAMLEAVGNSNFSFAHLAHSHILKPSFAFLTLFFSDIDVGLPWKYFLEQDFHLPPFILNLFYIAIFVLIIIIFVVFVLYSKNLSKLSVKIFFGIASFVFLENIVDGGALNPQFLIATASLFMILKNYSLALLFLLPLPAIGKIWFAKQYQLTTFLILTFYASLFIIASSKAKVIKTVGIIGLIGFIGFGFVTPTYSDKALREIFKETLYKLPPSQTIYYQQKGLVFPSTVLLTSTTTLQKFIKEHNVAKSETLGAIKIAGINCKEDKENYVVDKIKILSKNIDFLPAEIKFAPWIHLLKDENKQTFQLIVNDCLPNIVETTLLAIKQRFYYQEKAVLIAFIKE